MILTMMSSVQSITDSGLLILFSENGLCLVMVFDCEPKCHSGKFSFVHVLENFGLMSTNMDACIFGTNKHKHPHLAYFVINAVENICMALAQNTEDCPLVQSVVQKDFGAMAKEHFKVPRNFQGVNQQNLQCIRPCQVAHGDNILSPPPPSRSWHSTGWRPKTYRTGASDNPLWRMEKIP